MIEKFGLGYNPEDWGAFSNTAIGKGYKKEFLVKTGLSIENERSIFDRFRARVMFPVLDLAGKVIAFGGRTMSTDKKVSKYLNSPESEIYHKSKTLYGIYFAKKSIVTTRPLHFGRRLHGCYLFSCERDRKRRGFFGYIIDDRADSFDPSIDT